MLVPVAGGNYKYINFDELSDADVQRIVAPDLLQAKIELAKKVHEVYKKNVSFTTEIHTETHWKGLSFKHLWWGGRHTLKVIQLQEGTDEVKDVSQDARLQQAVKLTQAQWEKAHFEAGLKYIELEAQKEQARLRGAGVVVQGAPASGSGAAAPSGPQPLCTEARIIAAETSRDQFVEMGTGGNCAPNSIAYGLLNAMTPENEDNIHRFLNMHNPRGRISAVYAPPLELRSFSTSSNADKASMVNGVSLRLRQIAALELMEMAGNLTTLPADARATLISCVKLSLQAAYDFVGNIDPLPEDPEDLILRYAEEIRTSEKCFDEPAIMGLCRKGLSIHLKNPDGTNHSQYNAASDSIIDGVAVSVSYNSREGHYQAANPRFNAAARRGSVDSTGSSSSGASAASAGGAAAAARKPPVRECGADGNCGPNSLADQIIQQWDQLTNDAERREFYEKLPPRVRWCFQREGGGLIAAVPGRRPLGSPLQKMVSTAIRSVIAGNAIEALLDPSANEDFKHDVFARAKRSLIAYYEHIRLPGEAARVRAVNLTRLAPDSAKAARSELVQEYARVIKNESPPEEAFWLGESDMCLLASDFKIIALNRDSEYVESAVDGLSPPRANALTLKVVHTRNHYQSLDLSSASSGASGGRGGVGTGPIASSSPAVARGPARASAPYLEDTISANLIAAARRGSIPRDRSHPEIVKLLIDAASSNFSETLKNVLKSIVTLASKSIMGERDESALEGLSNAVLPILREAYQHNPEEWALINEPRRGETSAVRYRRIITSYNELVKRADYHFGEVEKELLCSFLSSYGLDGHIPV